MTSSELGNFACKCGYITLWDAKRANKNCMVSYIELINKLSGSGDIAISQLFKTEALESVLVCVIVIFDTMMTCPA